MSHTEIESDDDFLVDLKALALPGGAVQHGACQVLAYLGDGYFKERAGDPLQASLRAACGSTLKETEER